MLVMKGLVRRNGGYPALPTILLYHHPYSESTLFYIYTYFFSFDFLYLEKNILTFLLAGLIVMADDITEN